MLFEPAIGPVIGPLVIGPVTGLLVLEPVVTGPW